MAGGSMPNLEFADGTRIGSTNAIVRCLAAKLGYYPDDTIAAYHSDFLQDLYADYFNKLVAPFFI